MWSSQANQTPRTGRCVFAARREIEKTRGEFQLSRRQCGTKGTKWPVEELIVKCGVARPIGVEFARPLFPEQSSRRGQGNKLASGAKRTAQPDHAPLCSKALSTAAFVLVPAVGLAQEPANGTGNTKDEPGVEKVIRAAIGTLPRRAPPIQTTPILQRSKKPENSGIPGRGQLRLRSWRT